MNVHSYPRQKMCLRKKVMKSDLSSHSQVCTGAQTSRDSGIATETSDLQRHSLLIKSALGFQSSGSALTVHKLAVIFQKNLF